jgi:glycosyltransferase involved in cell wall biosynthesis
LSVIVPVFNEHTTVGEVLDGLAAHHVEGVELEVVVVESCSTDGSREIVQSYASNPRFKLVFEERPRGKGFAVRNGLSHATGDVFLIQDADLEYDLLDYQVLIEPIVSGRAAFVLGTRHAGDWKIRKFARNRLANALNVAHWAFVFAINQVYDQSMTDPFTMFKVFRADCLYGLDFECNRFDFDWEIVCKLLRKGYVPLEIPVNYQSRSFDEGKKVQMFRDPPTWMRALMKYRNVSPRQLREPSRGLQALEEGAESDDEPRAVERLRQRA